MSAEDIDAGARWSPKIEERLRESPFGIICLTRANQTAPWILFEAGALAKSVAEPSFVCPLLVDFEPSDLKAGPLTQFQAKVLTQSGVSELLQAINKASKENGMPAEKLERAFDTWWPTLAKSLDDLPKETSTAPKRTSEQMIEEILDSTRSIQRMLQAAADAPPPFVWPSPPAAIGQRDGKYVETRTDQFAPPPREDDLEFMESFLARLGHFKKIDPAAAAKAADFVRPKKKPKDE
jgi:hypothetical protein